MSRLVLTDRPPPVGVPLGTVGRFAPKFWTTNFNLQTSGAILTVGDDGFDVHAVLRRNQDISGAIWLTDFTYDHVWFRYENDPDYSGCVLEFDLEVVGDGAPLAGLLGPSLTITADGEEYFVRLWKYRADEENENVWANRFRIPFDETLLEGFGASGDPVPVDAITRILLPIVPRDYQGGATCTLQTEIVQEGEYDAIAVHVPGGRAPVTGETLNIWPFTLATDDHSQIYINAVEPAGEGYPEDTWIITPAPTFVWPWANTIPVGAPCQITTTAPGEPLRDQNTVTYRIRNIEVTGSRTTLAADTRPLAAHALGMTDGWDNAYPLTPELVADRVFDLGYRGEYVMYVGISHFHNFVWDAELERDGDTGGWVIDPEMPPINEPTAAWFADFAERLNAQGVGLWISVSFEILNLICPPDWRQLDADGNPALTGWDPPSSLVSVVNQDALDYLGAVASAFLDITTATGMDPLYQIGEPWHWVSVFEPGDPSTILPADEWVPFIYDPDLIAAWTAFSGLPEPTPRITTVQVSPEVFEANADYFAFCRAKLGDATNTLVDIVKAAHPTTRTAILVFTPQVLSNESNVAPAINLPPADQWGPDKFDVLMIEDYDWIILGEWHRLRETWEVALDFLGYALDRVYYFAGFNLYPETIYVWANTDRALDQAVRRGPAKSFPWSREQVWRDGWVYEPRASTFASITKWPDRAVEPVLGW